MRLIQAIKKNIKRNKFIRFLLMPVIKIYGNYIKNINDKNIKQFNDTYEKIFSRVLPSPVLVDLKEFLGVFELDIRSDLFGTIAFQGCYENDFLKIVAQYLDFDKDAVDIGANVGFFSIYFAKILRNNNKVLSIEPNPNAYNFLKKNVERNDCTLKIILYNGALTDQTNGKVTLNAIEGKEEYSSLGVIDKNYVRNLKVNQIEVNSTTLDNLVDQYKIKPGIVKIDTEGAEYLVIKGSLKTIREFRPVIISELCDDFLVTMNHSSKDIIDLLISNNYKIINAKTLDETISYPFNGEIIAVPK
jgi:FkbM family methyltransferase